MDMAHIIELIFAVGFLGLVLTHSDQFVTFLNGSFGFYKNIVSGLQGRTNG